ncbi:4Fe-4S dicluster domain-containing protein [bacterium]|nr:4Fe-4S dicluster domain-containing protein [candidate division CSSED10-310 bacterium]
MEELILTTDSLRNLVEELLSRRDCTVVGPTAGTHGYRVIEAADQLVLAPDAPPPELSIKQYLFPRSEPVLYFKKTDQDVDLIEVSPPEQKTVLFGIKPCDAKAPDILDKVFNWDYRDDFYNRRRANTLIVGMLCTYRDEYCFCTSVGMSPGSNDGSDLFLVPLGHEKWAMQIVSDKGAAFIESFQADQEKDDGAASKEIVEALAEPPVYFDVNAVHAWLDTHFEDPLWNEIGELCNGCGRCAYICPTCHCFDIVDEDLSHSTGRRMKNWDCCQFAMFTRHASSHNPRDNQEKRYRQRVAHKFKYYPDKFKTVLCTGCGRCSRGCPVTMDIRNVLVKINEKAER